MYYAGLRPEEAVSLRRDNVTLPPLIRNEEAGKWEEPPDAWGELRLSTAAPEVRAEWTDDGQRHDHRQLKARAPGEWRQKICEVLISECCAISCAACMDG